jgi:hypothetical protein
MHWNQIKWEASINKLSICKQWYDSSINESSNKGNDLNIFISLGLSMVANLAD